jgi:2-polyprenyl-6-methoxyphenol hydroxylase-like FAD-dependent oxidoreductase
MEERAPSEEKLRVRCCIVGGGPAGMMLGFLLARAGIDVVVLEKHADFLRDFRGDTIHPSTLEAMRELGILEELLKRPHQELQQLRAQIGETEYVIADFSRLRTQCRYIALMPQWDFLDFLAQQARRYPTFKLRTQAEVTGLIERPGRIAGVRAKTPTGILEIRAELVIGADGRNSIVKILVMIDRGDYWQCAFVIRKGSWEETQRKGIEELRAGIAELAPFLADRVSELRDWSDVKLLSVRVDRLRQWYRPGLLCIGDAAHAMSPIGGVGINLAIQDAIATANILAGAFQEDAVTSDHLAKVQRRRTLPTRLTQGFQVMIQKQVIARVLAASERVRLPWPQRRMLRSQFLSRIRGRIIGIGFRPEHVKTPDVLR